MKPLAALAMIDEGELDWKIVAISLDDSRASLVNDVDDVEKHFPVCFSIKINLLNFTSMCIKLRNSSIVGLLPRPSFYMITSLHCNRFSNIDRSEIWIFFIYCLDARLVS